MQLRDSVADLQPSGGGLRPAPQPVALGGQVVEAPRVERVVARRYKSARFMLVVGSER